MELTVTRKEDIYPLLSCATGRNFAFGLHPDALELMEEARARRYCHRSHFLCSQEGFW